MKKIMNFRPIVFICTAFVLGIIIGLYSLFEGYWIFILFIGIGTIVLLFYLSIYLFKLSKPFFQKVYKLRFLAMLLFGAILLGFLIFNAYLTLYNSKNIKEATYNFTSKIEGVYRQDDEYIILILQNVSIEKDDDIVKLKNKALFTFSYDEDEDVPEFSVGEQISGTAAFKNITLVDSQKINTFGVKNGYRYLIYSDSVETAAGKAGFLASLRSSAKEVLKDSLGEDTYPVAYALVFGDTSLIKSDTTDTFRKTGLAHIFAVSGLHVGFLMFLLMFVFKKLKLKYPYQFVISGVVLLFYAALCGFSPSVLRAAIMTLIYLLAKSTGRQYDGLSSLFLSGLIILTVSPMFLFDAGFQLSFVSVFSILILTPQFSKLFKFMPAFLNKSISASLSAQIGVLPLMAYYFNYISLLSVFLNVLIIPLVSIAFMSILIIFILSAMGLSFLFAFPQVILEFVLLITKAVANISFVGFEFSLSGGFIFYFLIIIILSAIVFIKFKFKAIVVSVLSCAFVITVVFQSLPQKFYNYKLSYYDLQQEIYSFTDDGNFYLVAGGSSAVDYENLAKLLKSQNIRKIKGVIIYKTTDNYLTLISDVAEVAAIENIYIRESLIADDVIYMSELVKIGYNVEILYYKMPVKTGNISLTLYGSLNLGNALYVDLYNYSVLFTGALNKSAYEHLRDYVFLSPNVVVAKNYINELNNLYKPQLVLTRYESAQIVENFYSIQHYGELIFSIKDGIIKRI